IQERGYDQELRQDVAHPIERKPLATFVADDVGNLPRQGAALRLGCRDCFVSLAHVSALTYYNHEITSTFLSTIKISSCRNSFSIQFLSCERKRRARRGLSLTKISNSFTRERSFPARCLSI